MILAFGIAFCVISVGVLVGSVSGAAKARARAAWPKVPATFLSGSVVEHVKSTVGSKGHRGRSVSYEPKVKYSYVVDGKERQGSSIAISPMTLLSRGAAEKVVDKYKGATELFALVSPADPKVAVLDPAVPGLGLGVFVAIFLGVAGVFMLANAKTLGALFDF